MSWVDRLEGTDAVWRERLLQETGRLPAALRGAEKALGEDWLPEVWAWIGYLRLVRGHAAKTCSTYVEAVVRFAGWLAGRGEGRDAVALSTLDGWMRWLYIDRHHTAGYRRLQMQAIRSFYRWRHRAGLGPDCAAELRGPRRAKALPRKYTVGQLRALFAAAADATRRHNTPLLRQRNRAILLVLLATGLRCDELVRLELSQVQILGDRTGLVRVDGKGAKERAVPIEGPVVKALVEWIAERERLEPPLPPTVFFTASRSVGVHRPMSPHALEGVIRRLAKSAGLGSWGVHRFRITFATQLYDDGVDIERIRLLMGHEDINTTRRYLAVSERMATTRLKAHRQHAAMGTVPEGLPLWYRHEEGKRRAG